MKQKEYQYIVHYPDPGTGESLEMPFNSLLQACRFAKSESEGLWEKAYVDLMEDGKPLTLAKFERGKMYRKPQIYYGIQNPYA
jgi:hypothetical protein